jgi:hypothetical protein
MNITKSLTPQELFKDTKGSSNSNFNGNGPKQKRPKLSSETERA